MEKFEKAETIRNLAQEAAMEEYKRLRSNEKLIFTDSPIKQCKREGGSGKNNIIYQFFNINNAGIIMTWEYFEPMPIQEAQYKTNQEYYYIHEYFNIFDPKFKKYINIKYTYRLEDMLDGTSKNTQPPLIRISKMEPSTNQILEFSDTEKIKILEKSPDYTLRKSEMHPMNIKDALELAKNLPAQIPFRRQPPKSAKK